MSVVSKLEVVIIGEHFVYAVTNVKADEYRETLSVKVTNAEEKVSVKKIFGLEKL